MPSHSIAQRAARQRAAEQPFTDNAFQRDAHAAGNTEVVRPTNGWFDSSFELRRGLEVIEWVLGPEVKPAQPAQ